MKTILTRGRWVSAQPRINVSVSGQSSRAIRTKLNRRGRSCVIDGVVSIGNDSTGPLNAASLRDVADSEATDACGSPRVDGRSRRTLCCIFLMHLLVRCINPPMPRVSVVSCPRSFSVPMSYRSGAVFVTSRRAYRTRDRTPGFEVCVPVCPAPLSKRVDDQLAGECSRLSCSQLPHNMSLDVFSRHGALAGMAFANQRALWAPLPHPRAASSLPPTQCAREPSLSAT